MDGIVDNARNPSKAPAFNLTIGTQAIKASEVKEKESNKKPSDYKPWAIDPKCEFTPLGESLESAMKTLLAKKIITLPEIKPFDPKPKLKWWKETDFYDFHRNKRHLTNNCIHLKHLIQDKIDNGEIIIDIHKTNNDHTIFT